MATDIELLLHRVVAEVFGQDASVTYVTDPKYQDVHRVRLSLVDGVPTDVGLRADRTWVGASIFDLDVGAVLFIQDDDAGDMEEALRDLAVVLRAYVRGQCRVEYRRTKILRRERVVVSVEIEGLEWKLGHRWSVDPRI